VTGVLAHMSSVLDLGLHDEMARRGYWIAYDDFGMNIENSYVTDANDERRVAWLGELLRRGLGELQLEQLTVRNPAAFFAGSEVP
jgi:predicted metal-dependent phosphotriesterase family hydrolase